MPKVFVTPVSEMATFRQLRSDTRTLVVTIGGIAGGYVRCFRKAFCVFVT